MKSIIDNLEEFIDLCRNNKLPRCTSKCPFYKNLINKPWCCVTGDSIESQQCKQCICEEKDFQRRLIKLL